MANYNEEKKSLNKSNITEPVSGNPSAGEERKPLTAPTGSNGIAGEMTGLPMESLICAPIIAAAKGQQELTAVYIDGIKKLAYATDDKGNLTDETKEIVLKTKRPVQDGGEVTVQDFEIHAPLLSLVPVPAFTMDELVVNFDMEVKNSSLDTSDTHKEASSSVNGSAFGIKASITGNVSSDSSHKRSTDSSAAYHISAKAAKQPPTEEMNKLVSLFNSMMEEVPASGSSGGFGSDTPKES